MDVSHILDSLNNAQREAVSCDARNCLVLSGAGSGKTRVLIHRIAWLMEVMQVSPFAIMAVTFTNRAASEMRERTEQLIGHPGRGLWTGTFHSIANRILRLHHQVANLPENFQILDSDDQFRVIRNLQRSMGIDEKALPPRTVQWFINSAKDDACRAGDLTDNGNEMQHTMREIFSRYDTYCQQNGLVDFAELLLRCYEILRDDEGLKAHFLSRYHHLLVDEFQDTNTVQYLWLQLFAERGASLFAVGDDDQSIYAWRGAKMENIFHFAETMEQTRVFRLEQNYRSTGTILKAANAVIANNEQRLGKDLWTEDSEGEPIAIYRAYNEVEEASYIVKCIIRYLDSGEEAGEMAVLYRSNAQSRSIEDQLLKQGIPYQVYGGLRFYERQEIKDALAYMRLIANRDDNVAFERIINLPARGIGDKTLRIIREHALKHNNSLWQSAMKLVDEGLPARASSALRQFLELVEELETQCKGLDLEEQAREVIEKSHIVEHYRKEPKEKAQSREENLQELVSACSRYVLSEEDEASGMSELQAFLSEVVLDAETRIDENPIRTVKLMTLHSAKGLEFKRVFIVGMEEGLFPSSRSLEEPGRLEEERRLCYVGITRARQTLHLCHAISRRIYGSETHNRPSRFLSEIPPELTGGQAATGNESTKTSYLELGQAVRHPKFGEGIILSVEGEGKHARVQVNFMDEGLKWLILAYANLEKI